MPQSRLRSYECEANSPAMALRLLADVSEGLEPVSVPLEGAARPDFAYICTSELPNGAPLVSEDAEGCACEGDCSEDCECVEEYGA